MFTRIRRVLSGTTQSDRIARKAALRRAMAAATWSFETALPDGYAARRIRLDVSLPRDPTHLGFNFADHMTDDMGHPTDTVVAAGAGAFWLSRDLGETWRAVAVPGYEGKRIFQIKAIGPSRFLAQAGDAADETSDQLDVLVLGEDGTVHATSPAQGVRWHGCRAVGTANGTIMYAEYPHNEPVNGRRLATSRVLRSRNDGASWDVVFQQSGEQIRHFHFLQPRPGRIGEWWLTSGDDLHESRVWVSKDDGNTWSDLTAHVADTLDIDGVTYQRRVFRLTDLIWNGDEVIWGTDDILRMASDQRGRARLFRSRIGDNLEPHLVGVGHWHFRNLIDAGDFFVALSQGCPEPKGNHADERPGVYLVPKAPRDGAPGCVHLFDVPSQSPKRTKLSASRASRAAKDGTFFSLRGPLDFFPKGNRILKWTVKFD